MEEHQAQTLADEVSQLIISRSRQLQQHDATADSSSSSSPPPEHSPPARPSPPASIATVNPSGSDKIVLDVGGKRFATLRSTLLRVEGTFFHEMLTSGLWRPDPDGSYFIDVNPKGFDRILDFFRTDQLPLSGLKRHELELLENLVDFFRLPRSLLVCWSLHGTGDLDHGSVRLLRNNKTVCGTSGVVFGSICCSRFSVQLEGPDNGVFIGFAPRYYSFESTSTSGKLPTCGWYLNAVNGSSFCGGFKPYSGKAVRPGNVVTAILNCTRKEISFEVDGFALGVAFRNIPFGELFPVIQFTSFCTISLMEASVQEQVVAVRVAQRVK